MDKDPISQNILGVQSLVGSKINKVNTGISGQLEGVEGEFIDELTLSLDDAELLALAKKWTAKYDGYETKLKLRQETSKAYYLGKQKEGTPYPLTDGQPIAANLLFEAEETFLPAALSKNPEPVVWSDNTPEGNKLSGGVKTMLQFLSDILALRQKLTLMVRHWSVYFVAIMKHGWDEKIGDISSEVRDPRNFILDPDGSVDCYGDYEGYLGERITVSAEKLIELFPKHKAYIIVMVDAKLGTDVVYTEWWTDEYCFYTFKDKVLDKNKNPNYIYPTKTPVLGPDGMEQLDEEDQPVMTEERGRNHFARPKKPYTFLSVFSFGEQPHDVTSLIEQNIPNQRRISRRTEQLDYNLSRSNNSDVFSEDNFTQETAKQAATGLAKGHPLLVPSGRPLDQAIKRMEAQNVPSSYFTDLETSKNDLRSIFGTQGITAQSAKEDTTARGMILNQQYDNTRIGGGIGDKLEQVAKNIFNWWVQLFYVYYDEEHFASVMGEMKAVEYIQLSSASLNKQLVISVAPDSMKPKDEITQMNQALSLWDKGAIDPKTLLKMLDFPDPQNTAEQTVLWLTDKNSYLQLNFPELAQKLAMIQAPANAPGSPPPPGGPAPEVPLETAGESGGVPANSSLSQVPLP